jgi:hypothetical protein
MNIGWGTKQDCLPCNILALGAIGAVGFAVGEAIRRRTPIGKTFLGQFTQPLAAARSSVPDADGGQASASILAECQVSGEEQCDVYEDWIERDGVRIIIGHHLENCHSIIESVDCGGRGGGPGDVDPGVQRQRCLAKSRRDFDSAVSSCQTTYIVGTVAIVLGGIICTIFGGGPLLCARAATIAEAALSANFIACMVKAERDKRDKDQDCLSEPVG